MSLGETLLELIQYLSPAPQFPELRNCDVGSAHVAFEIDDIFGLAAALRANGVVFYSEPIPIMNGPIAGGYFCYCRDPDGRSVELIQMPRD
jgi:catechol 2,3-dioxygenase-like lactoylglutathione lyase family enzyme